MLNPFIAYARRDGSEEAARLAGMLQAQGIPTALDAQSASHVILCVTPDAWRMDDDLRAALATAKNKPVLALLFPGAPEPVGKQVEAHTYIDWSDRENGFAALLAALRNPATDERPGLVQLVQACAMADTLRRGASAGQYFPGGEDAALLLPEIMGESVNVIVAWLLEAAPVVACRVAVAHGGRLDSALLERLRAAGVAIMTGQEPPISRAEVGRLVSLLGDPRPGITDLNLGWCEVPAGEFIFGGEVAVSGLEKPVKMTLPRFWVARYPITYAQFQLFVEDEKGFRDDTWWQGLSLRQRETGDQGFKFDNHPRERVSWYDSMAFCRWLEAQRRAGRVTLPRGAPDEYVIRLPTDQEWEKAARGTDGRVYPYPGPFDAAKGNTVDTGIDQTTAVGLFLEGISPYGALDMSGNVWEWCRTDFDHADNNSPSGTGSVHRVLRGGSWRNSPRLALATWRLRGYPGFHSDDAGFRVVCSVPLLQGL
jgi:formylglycine-generating enzyme required for sulfatase activity